VNCQQEENIQFYNQTYYNATHTSINKRLSDMNLSKVSASRVWYCLNEVLQKAVNRFVPQRLVASKTKKPLFYI